MADIGHWLARRIWWGMLRFMRLPPVRRARRRWMRIVPDSTARRMLRQDRFARRHGLAVLTFSLTLLIASATITGCYLLALAFINSGVLSTDPWRR